MEEYSQVSAWDTIVSGMDNLVGIVQKIHNADVDWDGIFREHYK